jgi:hypothetical protein
MKSNNSKKILKPDVEVIINSFTGNSQESQQSSEVLRLLKIKNGNIKNLIDINQELIFEKDKSKIIYI